MIRRLLRIFSGFLTLILLIFVNFFYETRLRPTNSLKEWESFRLFAKPEFEKWSAFEFSFIKAFYYTLSLRVYMGKLAERYKEPPPFAHEPIVRTADVVSKICPYYFDIYYIANGYLTWDYKDYNTAIRFLEFAVANNPSNYILYFFLGFDYFYFFKDYEKGAEYLIKASEISGNPRFAHLASKLLYASGRTEVAIGVLKAMIENTKDEGWKKQLKTRLKALEAIYYLEKGVESYRERFGVFPKTLEDLLKVGIITEIPKDPYGGKFYIDEEGNIKTTSNLSYIK
ncbi:MAG: tetratricopeptide repeat protein [Candidatus Hydrothermia bacterium]